MDLIERYESATKQQLLFAEWDESAESSLPAEAAFDARFVVEVAGEFLQEAGGGQHHAAGEIGRGQVADIDKVM